MAGKVERTPGPCERCGRNPAAGHASITFRKNGAWVERWYCHDGASPTCYEQGTYVSSDLESLVLFQDLLNDILDDVKDILDDTNEILDDV